MGSTELTFKEAAHRFLAPSDQLFEVGQLMNFQASDLESQVRHQLVMIEQRLCGSPPSPGQSSPPVMSQDLLQPRTCEICGRDFPDTLTFNFHMETHHPAQPYRCDVCPKSFSVPARLARHYRSHTGQKPYTCNICPKSFSVKENLSVHLRVHTQERPYPCTVCNRSFEHSGKLHRHMRIHTGERPHQCRVCNKTFIQSGQLVIHMRTHTGEKPYVCTTCEKGFTCSKQLKVHLRTHTGEKPYSCDICGKSFGYNHVLKLHQLAHFGEKVYKCTICKTTFANKKRLESHIKTHEDTLSPEMMETNTTVSSRPGSVDSQTSHTSDKENMASIYPSQENTFYRPLVISRPLSPPYPTHPHPAPLAHCNSSLITHPRHLVSDLARSTMDDQFILPSINTICPQEVDLVNQEQDGARVDVHLANRERKDKLSSSPITKSPVFPITPSLVENLMKEDLARYGPPTPLATPPLSPEIYAKCMVTTPTPRSPSPQPTPSPSISPSISMMTESSLPLRKRRLAYSECSLDLSYSPPRSTSPPPLRHSVIQFARCQS